jgi:hypothetical protein
MKLVLLLSFVAFGADASKILVRRAELSHWINMKIIIKELISRDHEVAIMRSSAYTDAIKIDIPEATYIDFYVPYEEGHHLQSMHKVLSQVKLGDPAESSFFGKAYAMVSFVAEQLSMRMNQCELVMSNSTLLNSLNATDFDLVLADPTVMCGELIATKMGVPFVYNVRTLPAELHFSLSQTPMPLSYVPIVNTEFSDKMNLFERTLNMITYAYQTIGVRAGLSMMDSIGHTDCLVRVSDHVQRALEKIHLVGELRVDYWDVAERHRCLRQREVQLGRQRAHVVHERHAHLRGYQLPAHDCWIRKHQVEVCCVQRIQQRRVRHHKLALVHSHRQLFSDKTNHRISFPKKGGFGRIAEFNLREHLVHTLQMVTFFVRHIEVDVGCFRNVDFDGVSIRR